MESALKYYLVVTYGGKPVADVEPDAYHLHNMIMDSRQNSREFHVLSARRCVITARGTVRYIEVYIDCDDDGVFVYDRYGSLIDSYHVDEETEGE